MKTLFKNSFRKSLVLSILVLFGFSLQSFVGITIKKRHYRKGYYVHICNHKCKVKLEGAVSANQTTVIVPQEKSEAIPELQNSNDAQRIDQKEEIQINGDRSIAPVSAPPQQQQQALPMRSTPVSRANNAPKN